MCEWSLHSEHYAHGTLFTKQLTCVHTRPLNSLQAVVARLEAEACEAREASRSEAAQREAAAATQTAAALKEAKKAESRWGALAGGGGPAALSRCSLWAGAWGAEGTPG